MQRGTDTREAILISAAALFAGVGYSSVSMRDIAKGAGITPGALYNHFRDKSALYAATMEHALGDRMSGLSEELQADAPREQRFRILVVGIGLGRWCQFQGCEVKEMVPEYPDYS